MVAPSLAARWPKKYEAPAKPKVDVTIQAHRSGDMVWIDWFRVPPEHRKQGHGKRAYKAWEARLPQDVREVRLVAADSGTGPSDGFWLRLGFQYTWDDEDLDYEAAQQMRKEVHRTRVMTDDEPNRGIP